MSEQRAADATPADDPQLGGAAGTSGGSPPPAQPARPDDEAPGNFVDDAGDDIPEPNEPA